MVTERVIIQFRADGTRVVQRDIKRVGKESKDATSQVDFLKKALAALGGTLVLRNALRTLSSFEQQMSTVRAITNATASDFERLRARAQELGTTTRFTATQAGEGLEQLARAGFSVTEALETVDDTLRLAQAGNIDLGSAAEITAKSVRGFRVDVGQATRFIDVLVKTSNSATTNVSELGEAFKFAAPVAASLGVSFEETSAALAVLADNALSASTGGTGLQKVLSTLAKGAPPLNKALARAGLTLADVDVESLGLATALDNLRKVNLSVGETFEIFGDRGFKAADILLANVPRVREFTASLGDAGGTAQRTADIMDDNLNGALLAVQSAYEGLILAFGNLGPTNALTIALRALASGLRFLADNVEIVAGALTGLAVATIPFLLRQLRKLVVALSANPFGLLVVAIGAAVGAIVAFQDEIKVTEDGMATLRDVFAVTFETIKIAIDSVREVFRGLSGDVEPELDKVEKSARTTFRSVVTSAAQAVDFVLGLFKGVVFGVVTVLQEIPSAIKNAFLVGANFAIDIVNDLLVRLQRQINGFFERIEVLAAQFGQNIQFERIVAPVIEGFDIVGTKFGDLGTVAGEEFRARLREGVGAEALVNQIFDQAEEQARIRAGEAAAAAPEATTTPTVTGDGAGDAGASTVVAEKRAIDQLIDSLRQENELLMEQAVTRAVLESRYEALEQLTKDSIDQKSDEGQRLLALVEQETRQNLLLQEKQRLLELLGPTEEQRKLTQEALNEILKDGNLTLEERQRLLALVNKETLDSNDALAGFADAFLKIDTSARGLGNSIGNLLVGSINKASNALSTFLIEGAQDTDKLKEAVSQLLKDLAQQIVATIIQLLIVAALKKALGGDAFSAPVGAGGGVPGLQAGGFVEAGRPVIVGERGPEPFVPTASGRVLPNSTLPQEQQPPQVTVINVQDPDEIAAFLNSEEGGDVILNTLSRRRKQAQETLGI